LIKQFGIAASVGILAVLGAAPASAHPLPSHSYRIDPIHYGRLLRPPTPAELRSARQVWQPVKATAPFGSNGAGTAVLMTDGTVLIQDNFSSWYKLTPDAFGSYINGTWSQAASLPSNYGPLYFADAILPDGRLIIEGGEYNFDRQVETTLGAIYDPAAEAWTAVAPPSGWNAIGDASGAVLANGTFMLGNCCSSTQALLDAATLTWTATGTGKGDTNSEEGWSLLPSGNILTVDVINPPSKDASEIYNAATGAWSSAGSTVVTLPAYEETGPQILLPDGKVFATGATGYTSLYDTRTGKWKAGPTFPMSNGQQLDIADGPGSLLVNGRALVVASPGAYNSPSTFFEFTGSKLVAVPGTPNSPQNSSYDFRMLPLPNGQILVTDGSNDVEIYTHGGKPKAQWSPVVNSVPTSLTHGDTYSLSGVYLNGFSQAGAYGDDAQAATNYPLVRITNGSTGHVFYAKTHDFTSMAVASPANVSTNFDVPASIETGASTLEVVANGIASAPISVTIQ
jgi:hypothetical protein